MPDGMEPERGQSIPGWNASSPLKSFQAFAGNVHEMAKQLLLKDGRHAEMMFFVPLNGCCQIVQWRGADRDAQVRWMKKHISAHYIFGVVHVCEVWMRIATTRDGSDPIMKRLAAGEMRVSELPLEDRVEALSVMGQTRDGWCHTWIDQIARDKAKRMVGLGQHMEFENPAGRFSGLFK